MDSRHRSLTEDEPPDRRDTPEARPSDPAEQGFVGERDQPQRERGPTDDDAPRHSER